MFDWQIKNKTKQTTTPKTTLVFVGGGDCFSKVCFNSGQVCLCLHDLPVPCSFPPISASMLLRTVSAAPSPPGPELLCRVHPEFPGKEHFLCSSYLHFKRNIYLLKLCFLKYLKCHTFMLKMQRLYSSVIPFQSSLIISLRQKQDCSHTALVPALTALVLHLFTLRKHQGLYLHQEHHTKEPASNLKALSLGQNKQTHKDKTLIQSNKGNSKSQRTHKHSGGVTAFSKEPRPPSWLMQRPDPNQTQTSFLQLWLSYFLGFSR